jgi:hypothetical protein
MTLPKDYGYAIFKPEDHTKDSFYFKPTSIREEVTEWGILTIMFDGYIKSSIPLFISPGNWSGYVNVEFLNNNFTGVIKEFRTNNSAGDLIEISILFQVCKGTMLPQKSVTQTHKRYVSCKCWKCKKFFKENLSSSGECPHCGATEYATYMQEPIIPWDTTFLKEQNKKWIGTNTF